MRIPDEARRAASAGRVIDAVKLTREHTGLGLKEAKDAVDAYLRGESGDERPAGGASSRRDAGGGHRGPDDAQLPSSAIACLYQGKLIDAIKKTGEEQGLGLKDAKEAVERFLAANPTVKAQFKSAAAANSSGVVQLIRIVAIAAVLTLVYLWFAGRMS